MKALVISVGVLMALAVSVCSVAAVANGSSVLSPAKDAIEANMPLEDQETSGVLEVLDEVGTIVRCDDCPSDSPDGAIATAAAVDAVLGAMETIKTDMPEEDQEESNVLEVLQGVVDLLSGEAY